MINIIILISFLLIILMVLFIMYHYKPYSIKPFRTDILVSGVPEGIHSPEMYDKLIKSSSLIDVKYIHSGNVKVKLSNSFNIKHPSCRGMKNTDITIPIFAYILHHERYGYFLIDTGCDSSYAGRPYGSVKGLLVPIFMPEIELEPELAIERQLTETELKSIKAVFFTHLHFDHTSGLPALPDNIACIAGKGERSYFMKGLIDSKHFDRNDTIYMIDFEADYAKDSAVGKAVDLFGDQTVWAISTPGHSKGHISYLINSKEGPVFIAGDVCTLNKCIELGVGCGTSAADVELSQATLEKIMLFLKQNPEVKLWCGHDFPI